MEQDEVHLLDKVYFWLINLIFFITAIGFNSIMTTASLALYITKRILYHTCYKMFRVFRFNRQMHRLNPLVLSVRRVLNTFVLNVAVIHTAKYVSLKCMLLAFFSKDIIWNMWMHFLPPLEMYLDHVTVTARNCCTIAKSACYQFAVLVLVHLTANMKLAILRKR